MNKLNVSLRKLTSRTAILLTFCISISMSYAFADHHDESSGNGNGAQDNSSNGSSGHKTHKTTGSRSSGSHKGGGGAMVGKGAFLPIPAPTVLPPPSPPGSQTNG